MYILRALSTAHATYSLCWSADTCTPQRPTFSPVFEPDTESKRISIPSLSTLISATNLHDDVFLRISIMRVWHSNRTLHQAVSGKRFSYISYFLFTTISGPV